MSARSTGGLSPEDLEYYADGAWYDAEYVHIKHDIPYYMRVASETEGRILELACGTGRLAIPMAEVGVSVLGVDVSPGMIARANEKRERLPPGDQARLKFLVDDMRTLRLEGHDKFGAVILGFNTLMHMTEDQDLEAVLRTARAHLAPGGLFHIDLHMRLEENDARDPAGRYDPLEMIDPRSRDRYVVTENSSYEPRTQTNTMRFFYQRVSLAGDPLGEERVAELKLRVIFPRELDRWLHLAGFETVGDWDDFERTRPFSGAGGRRVLMLRRK